MLTFETRPTLRRMIGSSAMPCAIAAVMPRTKPTFTVAIACLGCFDSEPGPKAHSENSTTSRATFATHAFSRCWAATCAQPTLICTGASKRAGIRKYPAQRVQLCGPRSSASGSSAPCCRDPPVGYLAAGPTHWKRQAKKNPIEWQWLVRRRVLESDSAGGARTRPVSNSGAIPLLADI